MHYLHGSEKLKSSNAKHHGYRPLFPQLQLQMRPSDNLENKTLYQSKYEKISYYVWTFKHTVFQKLHWGNMRTRRISGIERGITTSLGPTMREVSQLHFIPLMRLVIQSYGDLIQSLIISRMTCRLRTMQSIKI